jgi:hypothetical protein
MPILFGIELIPSASINDSRDVVCFPCIIVDGVALYRQIRRVPHVTVVQRRREDVDPEHEGGEDVGDGPGGHDEGRPDVCNLRP